MGKPAARISDMHTCPMVTPGLPPIPHVGGPIVGPGCPTVLIGGIPAAVMGDACTCVGPPDTIVLGSTGVLIGGKPAARMGDNSAHGGIIVKGEVTVLVGEMLSVWQLLNMAVIDQALVDARDMLNNKLAELECWDDAAKQNLKTWMGSDSEATRDKIKDRIKKQLELNGRTTIGSFKPVPDTEPDRLKNAYAYVYRNDKDHTVYIGKAFGPAPATGTNSKAGTLTHEMSHFSDAGGTKDNVYGENPCKILGASDPDKAQQNADSFEYYLEH